VIAVAAELPSRIGHRDLTPVYASQEVDLVRLGQRLRRPCVADRIAERVHPHQSDALFRPVASGVGGGLAVAVRAQESQVLRPAVPVLTVDVVHLQRQWPSLPCVTDTARGASIRPASFRQGASQSGRCGPSGERRPEREDLDG
jgi:hypothetical protein